MLITTVDINPGEDSRSGHITAQDESGVQTCKEHSELELKLLLILAKIHSYPYPSEFHASGLTQAAITGY